MACQICRFLVDALESGKYSISQGSLVMVTSPKRDRYKVR